MRTFTKTRYLLLKEALPEYRINDRLGGLAWIYPKIRSIKDVVDIILGRRWAVHIENRGDRRVSLYNGAQNQIELLDKLEKLGYNDFLLH